MAAPPSFAALRHTGYRQFFLVTALSMTADSIEHVISYWMMFEKFHSPALGGVAILTHWLPFLFFSVYMGALADRFDARRLIQIGMGIFMLVSLAWGLLFLTDSLQMWHAVVLLCLHGIAGVIVTPAQQLMIHDIVEPKELQSAVRLTTSSRMLGLLVGPAIGGAMMLVLSPATAILLNVFMFVPVIVWMWRTRYGEKKPGAARTTARGGWADMVAGLRATASNPTILLMTLLAGGASLMVGNAYQSQMPEYAHDLGHGKDGASYTLLYAADALGALVAGVILESRSLLPPSVRTAILLAMAWCIAVAGFAASTSYPLAVALMCVAGFLNLAFFAMAQTLVQMHAPHELRGRVIGMFTTFSMGMRAFSGVTVGVVGSMIGIHWSLALSAMILFAFTSVLLAYSVRTH